MHATNEKTDYMAPVLTAEQLKAIQDEVNQLRVSDEICRYIVDLCESVRLSEEFRNEVSSRGAISIMKAARACAYFNGHQAVFPEDVKEVFVAVLAHRLFLKSRTKSEYSLIVKHLKSILASTRTP